MSVFNSLQLNNLERHIKRLMYHLKGRASICGLTYIIYNFNAFVDGVMNAISLHIGTTPSYMYPWPLPPYSTMRCLNTCIASNLITYLAFLTCRNNNI